MALPEVVSELAAEPRLDAFAAGNGLGEVHRALSRPEEAVDHHRAALELGQAHGDRYEQARALVGLGYAHHQLGADGAAREHWQRAVAG